ncbi:MAG: transcription elongation factor, partial [Methylocystis sp.]|nr:transcription elongation factor [Methylocystis sp.]
MSSAFTKEQDDDNPREELPDRPVSPHRNLVTPEGLAQIEAELERAETEVARATKADDKHALAIAQRDLRYWTARRASAELVHPIADHS